MKIIFLGTNGWYDSETGSGVCALLDTGKEYFIFDAGNGIHKLDRYIKDDRKVYIFISHLHLDHISGLHVLNKFDFRYPICMLMGRGLKEGLLKVINPPYSSPLGGRNKVEIFEPDSFARLGFNMKVFPLLHSVDCYGLRLELGGKVIAYGGDTGICPGLMDMAKNADMLITECSYLSGERKPNWPHLNPEDAAFVAKDSGAGKLILTHFEAARYDTMEKRKTAEASARQIFPDTVAAYDGLEINID